MVFLLISDSSKMKYFKIIFLLAVIFSCAVYARSSSKSSNSTQLYPENTDQIQQCLINSSYFFLILIQIYFLTVQTIDYFLS